MRFEARIPAGTIGFCITPALDPAECPGCVFPKLNWLTRVVDLSLLSSNVMWWTGTAVTSPLLGKLTEVYNWLHAVEFFLEIYSPSVLSKPSLSYNTRIFQYAVHNNKSLVAMSSQKMAVLNINTKNVLGKCVYEVGRRYNREFVCSLVC